MTEGSRRLAAIMFTDMVGYTALGQENEALSIELAEEQRALIRPILEEHRGREVKTIGDAFLVEFASAVEAVECAVKIQSALAEANRSRPDERKLRLRIGVHLGDVVHIGADVAGDAVNVASRIEPLALPGGVCVSSQVYDSVVNKVRQRFESIGFPELKNVSAPVEVYRVAGLGEPTYRQPQKGALRKDRVAVLPFVNMSKDPDDEYFADGITEEVISSLSTVSELSVISRTSVMGYKGTAKKVGEVGRELNVGTVLEGSCRRAGNKIRVTAQLVDAGSDRHLWAQSYDRELSDVFAIQSDIAQRVAESTKVKLLEGEKVRIEKVQTASVAALESYLKGLALALQVGHGGKEAAIKHFEDAIAKDPNFAAAYAALGNIYVYLGGVKMTYPEAFGKARPLIERALQLDPESSDGHLAKGNLALQDRLDYQATREEFKTAIRLNPSNAFAHWWYSVFILIVYEDIEGALAEALRAQELNPLSSEMRHQVMNCYWVARDYDRAAEITRQDVESDPGDASFHSLLAIEYFFGGRRGDAEREFQLYLDMAKPRPNFGLSCMLALFGRVVEARKMVDALGSQDEFHWAQHAMTWVVLGEKQKALDVLEAAYGSDRNLMDFLTAFRDPTFDPIRDEPRFVSLVKSLHLPARRYG